MKTILKLSENIKREIQQDIAQNEPKETILFLIAKVVPTPLSTLYIGEALVRMEEDEITKSPFSAVPNERFLRRFYTGVKRNNLFEKGYRIVVLHSHPFSSQSVHLSYIDWGSINADQEVYKKVFPGNEFLFIVFDRTMSCYEGYAIHPDKNNPIDSITSTGKNFEKLYMEKPPDKQDEMYSRMLLMPGFYLEKFKNLRIGIVGMGGVGSCIFQLFVMLGIGENHETIIADFDRIEASNLSRIPFASREQIGQYKVKAAKQYAKRLRKNRNIIALSQPCYDEETQKYLASCDIVIGASDSDLARLFLNHLSSNFLIPVIDIGAGVIIDKIGGQEIVMSGSQSRIYIPGENPCLLCNMGLDFNGINKELAKLFLNENEKQVMNQGGYLQNLTEKERPQPSVFNLNQHAATLATDMLISYILKGYEHDTIHFDLEGLNIQKIKAKPQELCPHCGNQEFLAKASFLTIEELRAEKKDVPGPSFEKKAVEKKVPKEITRAKEDNYEESKGYSTK